MWPFSKGHPVIPVPLYVPGAQKFYGEPDANGAVDSDEIRQADAYIKQWAKVTGNQKFAVAFYNPPAGSGVIAASAMVQADHIGDFFPNLTSDQLKANNLGTRAQRFLTALMLPAVNAGGTAVDTAVAAPQMANWASEGSVFNWRIACFQHNLNVGWYGQSSVA